MVLRGWTIGTQDYVLEIIRDTIEQMPNSTICLLKRSGQKLSVKKALVLYARDEPELICIECRWRVRPISGSRDGINGSYFKHSKRNPKCPLSDKRFPHHWPESARSRAGRWKICDL